MIMIYWLTLNNKHIMVQSFRKTKIKSKKNGCKKVIGIINKKFEYSLEHPIKKKEYYSFFILPNYLQGLEIVIRILSV